MTRLAVWIWLALLTGLTACGKPETEPAFDEGPKGYVEFYLPESEGVENLHRDVQIFHVLGGEREFLGMTRKWGKLTEARRGLTATLPPGKHDFIIAAEDAEAAASVQVEKNGYRRVKIGFTGIGNRQLIGTTQQVQFGIRAEVEPLQ
jgi:hypothetical protein